MSALPFPARAKPRDSSSEPAHFHILLVDDDETWAAVAGGMLRRAGFTVQIAADYRIALNLLESDAPIDLMLTDIVMPQRVNGVALGRMARMRRRDLKLMYMTAYDIPGLDNETQDPVLIKPIDEDRLVQAVKRALSPA